MMKRLRPLYVAAALLALAGPAFADCTVHYKAKRDNPLKLDAGSLRLKGAACGSEAAAAAEARRILAGQGWTLLAVVAILPDS